MADTRELEARFWKHLDGDRVVLLGAPGIPPRPMTAIAEDERTPLWFFTAADTDLGKALDANSTIEATATFSAKGHDLFATLIGTLVADNNRATIDRLWNPFIAAWFDGKDDPKLRLLRMDVPGLVLVALLRVEPSSRHVHLMHPAVAAPGRIGALGLGVDMPLVGHVAVRQFAQGAAGGKEALLGVRSGSLGPPFPAVARGDRPDRGPREAHFVAGGAGRDRVHEPLREHHGRHALRRAGSTTTRLASRAWHAALAGRSTAGGRI